MLIRERNELLSNMAKYGPAKDEVCAVYCKNGISSKTGSLEDCPNDCSMKIIRQYVASSEVAIALHCLEGRSENVKPFKNVTKKEFTNSKDLFSDISLEKTEDTQEQEDV